jgi:hypothetical protein
MTVLPQGWDVVYGFGIRQLVPGSEYIVANVGLEEENLGAEDEFEGYLAKQTELIKSTLSEPKIAGPQPTSFPGCDEARLILVLHAPPGVESIAHVQTYVRVGPWVGIITLTAPQEQLQNVRPYSDQFTQGLRILPGAPDVSG